MKLEAGDLVLVPFPFSDLSAAKSRPALVMSLGAHNHSSPDVMLCGVTSNLNNSARSVLVSDDDLESGRLPKPSRIKVDKIVTLQQSLVRKRVARVNAATMSRVMKEFETLFP